MWRRRKAWVPAADIAHQRAMNRMTWQALREHGVTEQSELRLDFSYDAPSRDAAEELAGFLRAETDYEVRAEAKGVEGSTQPTAVSQDVLDQWVAWMVLAGFEHGGCSFDGWGAAVP